MQEVLQFWEQHTLLSLVWVFLAIAVLITTFRRLFSRTKELSRSEATFLINKEEAIVVDIRSRDEFRKGHIINAINLTASEIKTGNLGELNKVVSRPVIVACATGMSARTAAENLSRQGFNRVFLLKEGISGWQAENLPLVSGK